MSQVQAPATWEAKALAVLEARCRQTGAEGLSARLLHESLFGPLRHFLTQPGKGLRAALVRHGWQLAQGTGDPPAEVLALVELLHAGSLILDDIQDDADFRRGQPALHRRYGMPLALNAANYLLFLALDLCAALALQRAPGEALRRLTCQTLLSCHEGQALDLAARVSTLPQAEIPPVVAAATVGKTGALMALAAGAGAIAAGAAPATASAIAACGQQLGIALQMLDDLGSLTSPARANKGHEDLLGDRPTWPWAWLAASLPAAEFLPLQRAHAAVIRREHPPEALAASMRARLGDRRQTVHAHLLQAIEQLEDCLAPTPASYSLRQMILQMEHDYV